MTVGLPPKVALRRVSNIKGIGRELALLGFPGRGFGNKVN